MRSTPANDPSPSLSLRKRNPRARRRMTGWRTRDEASPPLPTPPRARRRPFIPVTRRVFKMSTRQPHPLWHRRLLEWIMLTAAMKGDQEINWTHVVQTCRDPRSSKHLSRNAFVIARFPLTPSIALPLSPPPLSCRLLLNQRRWTKCNFITRAINYCSRRKASTRYTHLRVREVEKGRRRKKEFLFCFFFFKILDSGLD